MQTVILCGGEGTRLREYTESIPKPLVEVGGKPILWHIMKGYAHFGHNEFVLCLGYKGEKIKEYFEQNNEENWKITFEDTGEKATKAERLLKVQKHIKGDTFLCAYGDDVSDVDISKVIELHKKEKKTVTLTAVNPESQFGVIQIEGNAVTGFIEKPKLDTWINGGFFVMDKKIFKQLSVGKAQVAAATGPSTLLRPRELEDYTFKELAKLGQISAYKHNGFWKCMNVFKDVVELNELWSTKKAPWKVWNNG